MAKGAEMAKKDDLAVEENSTKDLPVKHVVDAKKAAPWPIITIGIVGTVLVLAAVAMAWLQLFSLSNRTITSDALRFGDRDSWHFERREPMQGSRDGMRGGGQSRVVATGVITAINGDAITVSGGGKQVTVKKTETTRIAGNESAIAVNDTVVVYGTKNDDESVTATRIVVRNGDVLEDSIRERPERSAIPSA